MPYFGAPKTLIAQKSVKEFEICALKDRMPSEEKYLNERRAIKHNKRKSTNSTSPQEGTSPSESVGKVTALGSRVRRRQSGVLKIRA
jgi:hypothetical protein